MNFIRDYCAKQLLIVTTDVLRAIQSGGWLPCGGNEFLILDEIIRKRHVIDLASEEGAEVLDV